MTINLKKLLNLLESKQELLEVGTINKKNNQPLLIRKHFKSQKWNDDQMKLVVDYYFEHGESYNNAIKLFGYPSRTTLRSYVIKDKRFNKQIRKKNQPVFIDLESKKKIVIEKGSRECSVDELSKKYNISRQVIYDWENQLTGEMSSGKKQVKLTTELNQEVDSLKKEYEQLLMENKILKKANELLKKEVGIDYSKLTNQEKTLVINALKSKYSINSLLKAINLSKSSYYYSRLLVNKDKYKGIRKIIKETFLSNY